MEADHDHLPVRIFKIVGEIQDKWLEQDKGLHNIEKEFFTKMKDYGPLLTHF
jgi:hypothetical protein